jgi:hypothetical protein
MDVKVVDLGSERQEPLLRLVVWLSWQESDIQRVTLFIGLGGCEELIVRDIR